MTEVFVVGIGMTKFGKHPDRAVADLGTEAVLEAIRDADIDPRRIEAAYCGHVFQGMVAGQRGLAQTGLVEASVGLTMPAIYAMRARRHMEEFGTTRRQLALVSVKNKRNASLNPLSQFQKPVSVEEVIASRPIAEPLCLYDCSPA